MPNCFVSECERKYYAMGWCEMHYQRVKKYGQPDGGPTTHAPPEVRFMRRVEKSAGCWNWMGAASRQNGYGKFQSGTRQT